MSGGDNRKGGGKTAFVNARLLDPASGLDAMGGLLVDGEEIARIGEGLFADGPPKHAQVVDCKGKCLAPGLVDMRVQLREPGDEHKETIESGSRAALAGGVTTMVCLPNTTPPIDDVAVVEFVARRAREVKGAKVFCYGAVTKGMQGQELTEMGLLAQNGAVAFTDGTRTVENANVMRRALSYATTFDLLIVQHPEEPALAGSGSMNAGEKAMRLGLTGIPSLAEVIMIERDLRLVEMTDGRYHAAHVSTKEAVEAIRKAKAAGLRVSCDTAPQYFTLTEEEVGEYRTFAKLSPPLRAEADRAAIAAGLADGTIDAIASDHAPHDQDSKRLPFAQAEFGMVGLESLLPLALALYHKGELSLLDAIGLMTYKPADLLKLDEGRLVKGGPADLVLFDPDKPQRLVADDFLSKSKNSPLDDYPVQGKVLRTYVSGRLLYDAEAA